MSNLFPFGKHRGKSFQEVANEDRSYCEWACRVDNPSGALQEFVSFLRSTGKAPPSSQAGGSPGTSSGSRPSYSGYPGGNRSGNPGGARPAGCPAGCPAGFQPPEERLAADSVFVCEVVPVRRFLIRAERVGPQNGPPGREQNNHVFVPSAIYHKIGSIPGAQRAALGWTFPLDRHDYVADCLQQMGAVERIPQWVLYAFRTAERDDGTQLNTERLPKVEDKELLPYQLEGVRFGVSLGGRCLIGDEMGLGKTLQALSIAVQYVENWPVLIVCPATVRFVWKEQIMEWISDFVQEDQVQIIKKGADKMNPNAAFWIISYNLLATDAKKMAFQKRPDGTAHGVIIADESHNIKEWSAARTKVLVPLLQNAQRAILLSGTPTRNSADELHPQLCGLLRGMNAKYQHFRSRYCVMKDSVVFGGKTVSKVAGARNTTELNYLLTSTVMVRRLKKDVLTQLPEKRRQRIPIEVTDTKALKDIQQNYKNLGDPEIAGDGVSNVFKTLSQVKVKGVKEYILEVLEHGSEKAIIFAHHHDMMDALSTLLEDQLPKEGQSYVRIDGRTPGHHRQDLVRRFQEEPACRIALLSITACSEGLTLTAAGLVIFAELYWVPGAVEQAEARAHRIGTTHTSVIVQFLVVPNSPDEQIYKSLERKKKVTSTVLNGCEESLAVSLEPARVKKRQTLEAVMERQETKAPGSAAAAGDAMVDEAQRILLGEAAPAASAAAKAKARGRPAKKRSLEDAFAESSAKRKNETQEAFAAFPSQSGQAPKQRPAAVASPQQSGVHFETPAKLSPTRDSDLIVD